MLTLEEFKAALQNHAEAHRETLYDNREVNQMWQEYRRNPDRYQWLSGYQG